MQKRWFTELPLFVFLRFHYSKVISNMKQLMVVLMLFAFTSVRAQLKPGFDKTEYLNLLEIFSRIDDTTLYRPHLPYPAGYTKVYRSKENGLKNRWELWYNKERSVAVICIRGTVAAASSWLENFYAAMVPAHGHIQLNDSITFSYRLATDTQAMVHAGWLLGMASMAPDIVSKIKESYARGIHQFLIAGHSQGGAITFLLRSYLHYQTVAGNLPSDIIFKTYCSAAPKPGNLFYAYDFDAITRNGWAFTVVNTADWVPETPVSIQTLYDFSQPNPFIHVSASLRKQSFFVRWYLKAKYKKLNHVTNKAARLYRKNLGPLAYRQIKKYLPQLRPLAYGPSNNYQRAGIPIVLQPNQRYWQHFPRASNRIFLHHLLEPYFELAEQY
jgi:Lipase (class 3)